MTWKASKQVNAWIAPAELKKAAWAVLKGTTADKHFLEINLA